MNRLLKVGDVFKVKQLDSHLGFRHKDKWVGKKLKLLPFEITIDQTMIVHWTETQTRPGGWKRDVMRETDLSAPWALEKTWRVVHTQVSGGGTGHGPHDVYPDGHYVEAESAGTDEEPVKLTFYQTGCFIPMIDQKDIILVKESK